ncbi:MAG TPA: hypothetical protein VHU80_22510 [Polyangiaceae bacterium]|jgi:hypothetical protein|nr:hypothetical protein [Polyangiaceae bacterium]
MTSPIALPSEHAALFKEAKGGIERLVARMTAPPGDVLFLVADADCALGKVIVSLGAPRHPGRRSVVMPMTRDDAIRAAGPLMGPSISEKLAAHRGPAVLVMASGTAELVSLRPTDSSD